MQARGVSSYLMISFNIYNTYKLYSNLFCITQDKYISLHLLLQTFMRRIPLYFHYFHTIESTARAILQLTFESPFFLSENTKVFFYFASINLRFNFFL